MIAPLFLVVLLALSGSAVGCFIALRRCRRISDRDTRKGLRWLLGTAGAWATFQVGYLIVPGPQLKEALYLLGLIVGFSTVGPWLYFCSAYTGRSFHRSPKVHQLAVGIFLAVAVLKLTNPLHGLYFSTALVTTPFRFLAVDHGLLHWVVVGFAYALSAVGYFMLVEQFWQVDHDTGPLIILVGLTGLPILPELIGATQPQLPNLTYEPIGVAIFAVGVLYLYLERFEVIQLTMDTTDPVLLLDDMAQVREYNGEAAELFPDIVAGESIEAVAPVLEGSLDVQGADVIEFERVGGMRYYQLTTNQFTNNISGLGTAITLTDITEREQYRTELERQNERLDRFAKTVSHDLRNPLNVAVGRLEMARQEADSEHLQAVDTALTRMEGLITEVLQLAKQGEDIAEMESVSLDNIVSRAWAVVDTEHATLIVEDNFQFEADSDRLEQVLENLFRNAIDHCGPNVTVRVGTLEGETGFYVEDDGPHLPRSCSSASLG